MKDVTVQFTAGPLSGKSIEVEVGEVVIGRQPGHGGIELVGADTSVSRSHAELVEIDGNVVVRNKSPNGTMVNDKLVLDQSTLESGAKISIGDQFEFELTWWSAQVETIVTRKPRENEETKKSPLSSPVVRAVLVVYLGGILAVGIWFGVFADSGAVGDDWPGLLESYQAFQDDRIKADEWLQRQSVAANLVRELKAMRTRGETRGQEIICRELMQIDGDPESPLYRYGAQCLVSQ